MEALIRQLARRLLPKRRRDAIARLFGSDKDLQKVFSKVYQGGLWGAGVGGFYSGTGSHDPEVVLPYVEAMRAHLQGLKRPVRLVDLGCGDFNVGRQLVDCVDSYIGCDVVPELIARNRREFRFRGLTFEVVNAVEDDLPDGDIVCVRQVLQHLNNRQIGAIVSKLGKYRQWVITEALPGTSFKSNVDKAAGEHIRLVSGSGVVLTEPPFDVKPSKELVLCEVPQYGGVVRTTSYCF